MIVAALTGLFGEVLLYGRAPAELRAELSLTLLFGTASVLSLVVGAAKIEAALADKDGPRAVRRVSGILAGSFFGMAAVGAASLDLSSVSLVHARLGWSLMFAFVASVMVVFAERGRYVGAGFLALGQRAAVLALVGLALLVGARLTVAAPLQSLAAVRPAVHAVVAMEPSAKVSTVASAPEAASAPAALPSSAPEAPVGSAAPPPSAAAAPPGKPGQIEIASVTSRGLLEADARGGVQRRLDRLQACVDEPKNQQRGVISLKVGVDASGSVGYARLTGGELSGTPLANCLLLVFYKMGFAAPASNNAGFDITLRAP